MALDVFRVYHLYILFHVSVSVVYSLGATYRDGNAHSLVHGRPINISPPDATCRPPNTNTETYLEYYPVGDGEINYGDDYGGGSSGYYNNQQFIRIDCTAACPKTFPVNHTIVRLLPAGLSTVDLGEPDCSLVPDVLRNPNTTSIPRLPPSRRRKRQSASVCSLAESASALDTDTKTYTLWVKPGVRSAGTLVSAMSRSYGLYSLDLERGVPVLRVMDSQRAYRRTIIPPQYWTHITLQISNGARTALAVYVNGSLLADPVLVNELSRFRRGIGDGSVSDPVFIGVSGKPYFDGHDCQVSHVPACRNLQYSAFVYVDRQGPGIDSMEDDAQRLLMLAKRQCPDTPTHIRDGYICSSVLPTCSRSGKFLRPCQSTCLDYFRTCALNDALLLSEDQCRQLPQNGCVKINNVTGAWEFTPEYGMYRGSLRDVKLYGDALTEREIAWDYSGSLPPVQPSSDCLCPQRSTKLETDLICSSLADPYSEGVSRLGDSYYVPEAIIDPPWPWYRTDTTSWYSAAGLDSVVFTVQFGKRQLLSNMTFETPRHLAGVFPESITFQLLDGDVWKTVAHVARDCGYTNGQPPQILSMTEAPCQQSNTFSSEAVFRMVWSDRSGVESVDVNDERVMGHGWRLHPIAQDYLSGTAIRVQMAGFLSKQNLFFAVTNIGVNGWDIPEVCDCFPGALADNVNQKSPCDEDNRCICRPGAGDPAVSHYTCYPYILEGTAGVIPHYGPESGGTIVTINGGYFGTGNVTVYLNEYDIQLTILKITETRITCLTPNVTGRPLYVPNVITVVLYENSPHHQSIVPTVRFEFREDPVIESITPLSTFLRGGIEQTVVGQFLDSVYAPFITVTVVYTAGGTRREYPQPPSNCTVTNSSAMICRSPEISNVPEEYEGLLVGDYPGGDPARRKRSTQSGTDGFAMDDSRVKRSDFSINEEDFQFYVGFLLDGVTTYKNVSEPLPEYGIIKVFTNPEIFPWSVEDRARLFQPYSGDIDILIEGKRMTYGCTRKDYTIQIGEEFCEVTDLFDNTLQCNPPPSRPELGNLRQGKAPGVIASVGNIRQFIGYLEYHETAWDNPRVKGGILGAIVGVLVIVIAVVVAVVVRKRRAQQQNESDKNKYVESPTPWSMLPASVKAELEPCLKDGAALKLGSKVGEGNFGTVFVGRFNDEKKGPILVAAKTIKDQGITVKELMEFLEEATLMKDFKHENVLNLVGVVLQDNTPYVLLPLMENGDLRAFLLKPDNQFTVRDLLDYSVQVARGMQYLSSLKFVHRDLAARNCMVSKDNVVKVADFGLARDIYSNEYYRVENKSRPLPVKWMAPEALDDFKFTAKSDVWSYGVLVWELLTRGKKPYSHVDNFDLKNYLKQGNRLEKPGVAPDEVYELMLQCWNMNPANRPEFVHIVRQLDQVLDEEDGDDPQENPQKPAENPHIPEYQTLGQYVDYTTDRHGYEHIHTEQGYLDMASGQIDYVQAAKDLGVDPDLGDDGYLAPVDCRHGNAKPKPKPKPRHSAGKGRHKMAPEYQNMEGSTSDNIHLVEVSAPDDNKRTNVPVYMNTRMQNVQYAKEC